MRLKIQIGESFFFIKFIQHLKLWSVVSAYTIWLYEYSLFVYFQLQSKIVDKYKRDACLTPHIITKEMWSRCKNLPFPNHNLLLHLELHHQHSNQTFPNKP